MIPVRLGSLSEILLLKIYQRYVAEDSSDRSSFDDIVGMIPHKVSRNLVASALDTLLKTGRYGEYVLQKVGTKDKNNIGFRITTSGIQHIERLLRKKSSLIRYYYDNGDSVFLEVVGFDSPWMTESERMADEDWEPISFDHDAKGFIDAVDAIDDLLAEIQKNNEFEARYPNQKQGIVNSLEKGLEILKGNLPTKNSVFDNLVKPIRWIITNFTNTALTEFAKRAAQKLMDLFQ